MYKYWLVPRSTLKIWPRSCLCNVAHLLFKKLTMASWTFNGRREEMITNADWSELYAVRVRADTRPLCTRSLCRWLGWLFMKSVRLWSRLDWRGVMVVWSGSDCSDWSCVFVVTWNNGSHDKGTARLHRSFWHQPVIATYCRRHVDLIVIINVCK